MIITLTLLTPLQATPIYTTWSFKNHERIFKNDEHIVKYDERIETDLIRIGRATDNQVVLYSSRVSGHHAELRFSPNVCRWTLMNISAKGTYLEGKRVTQAPVSHGSKISLAQPGPTLKVTLDAEGQGEIMFGYNEY